MAGGRETGLAFNALLTLGRVGSRYVQRREGTLSADIS
jgi:hypothetical protein